MSSASIVYSGITHRNFMYHPVKWACKPGSSPCRKVMSLCSAVLLSFTGVGLILVIPGIKEWKRQVKKINANPKNSFLQTVAKLNNSSVKGQVHGIYITTNEKNLKETNKLLKTHAPAKRAIHIGCAAWHNFDIMCARKSEYGLIVDFNPKNAEFIKITIDLIKASESREAFKDAMIGYLNSLQGKDKKIYFHSDQHGLPTDKIEEELSRKGSWLSSEGNYLFIKDIVSNDHLIAITENITNHKAFSKIRTCLESHNMAIDTVYLSNICNFMKTKNDKEAFVQSVHHIVQNDTILINCPKLMQANSSSIKRLHQISLLGNEVLKNPTQLFEMKE